jgi:hypothetical protein
LVVFFSVFIGCLYHIACTDAEEDNTNAIDFKNLLNEAADSDNVKEENQTVPAPEAKDLHEKLTGLALDVPTGAKDPHIENDRPGDEGR